MTQAPRKPGRPKDPELETRRRREILDVAARIFAQQGFTLTQVQTIAQELGIGNGTIYRYFATKEQLFLAAVDRGLQELDQAIEDVLQARQTDGIAALTQAIHAYLDFFYRRPEMAELFIQERAAFPHHHRPLYFTLKDDCDNQALRLSLLNQLIDQGLVRPIPAEQFFSFIGDLLYGIVLTNLLANRPLPPAVQVQQVIDMLFLGILTEDARSQYQQQAVQAGDSAL